MKLSNLFHGVAAATALVVVLSAQPASTATTPPGLGQSPDGRRVLVSPPGDAGLNRYQRDLIQRYASGATVAVDDTLRLIAFQVEFSDSAMGGRPGGRPELRDSLFFANELQHVTEYFRGASRGHMEVEWTLDGTLYTLPEAMGYYGRDTFEEERVVELVETLVGLADGGTDFSQYDHVFVIHAGAGQETDLGGDSRSQIWSSFYDASDIDAAFPDTAVAGLATDDTLGGDPFVVDNFSIVPANASQDFTAIGSLGIWVFEVGSRLGLLPLFDSTPEVAPDGQGAGSFCMMSFGLFTFNGFLPSFPCAFNRMIAGWLDPVTVEPTDTPQALRLADVNTGADTDTTCVRIPITENEYYLVVNRVHDSNFDSLFTFTDPDSNFLPDNTDGFDGAEFDFYMTNITDPFRPAFLPDYGFQILLFHTGSGMYVWHIDENVVFETLAAGFLPNDFVERKAVDLEEADGVQDMDGGGVPAFVLGSHFDSFRDGDGNQHAFGPDTEPASKSNAGVRTGIRIDDISVPGPFMTCVLQLDSDYDDHRVRWDASAFEQPPSVFDFDDDGDAEIAVLADSGRVYMFDATGAEYSDGDSDPSTIEPFASVSGEWAGPPAIADVDGGGDMELVAVTAAGELTMIATDAVTTLRSGLPGAAPPMLVDVTGGAEPEIVITERDGDSLRVRLLDATGTEIEPGESAFDALWPVSVQGHMAAPLAWGGTAGVMSPAKEGVVLAWVDTLDSAVRVRYTPARHPSGPLTGEPVAGTWTVSIAVPPGFTPGQFMPSAPAVGDIDADGHDEVVVTTPDGRLFIFENDGGETGRPGPTVVDLRASFPSAPALGDTDLDGTLEIAVWDEEYMYLLEWNGRPVTEWPKRIVPPSVEELPPHTVRRGLESPVVADVDGDGAIDVLFPLGGGELYAFDHNGRAVAGFPRVGPANALATPTVDELGGATGLSLVTAGTVSSLTGINTVRDTFATTDETVLSIQTLPGTSPGNTRFWSAYRNGVGRSGRVVESHPLLGAAPFVETGSFMIYPSPVTGDVVNVRVTLNGRATVTLEVYNLEGEEAISRRFEANAGGLIDTPFDEAIDVSDLVSGLYFVRLGVDGDEGGSETLVKPFAIRR